MRGTSFVENKPFRIRFKLKFLYFCKATYSVLPYTCIQFCNPSRVIRLNKTWDYFCLYVESYSSCSSFTNIATTLLTLQPNLSPSPMLIPSALTRNGNKQSVQTTKKCTFLFFHVSLPFSRRHCCQTQKHLHGF